MYIQVLNLLTGTRTTTSPRSSSASDSQRARHSPTLHGGQVLSLDLDLPSKRPRSTAVTERTRSPTTATTKDEASTLRRGDGGPAEIEAQRLGVRDGATVGGLEIT